MTRNLSQKIPLLFVLFGASVLSAQQLATLNVTVTDPTGRVVSNANVTLNNQSTGIVRNQSADRSGLAVLTALSAGDYLLKVQANGFSDYEQPLTLTVGQVASVSARLGVATVKQSVSVSESSSVLVDTQKTETSQVIRPKQIEDLPIAGRDFVDFVLLTPKANVGRSTATASQSPFLETVLELSFGGLRETHSSFFGLDGTDYTVSLSGVQRASPSLDWVQEFRVVDGPFAADNGRNLGSVVKTITKSGSNNVHGSAYEYFRNEAADADNPLSAPGLNALRFNQFGADVGGPIRSDKTFYFAGYEGQRERTRPPYSTFILGCINNPGCMGPGTPSINQVKDQFGLRRSAQFNIRDRQLRQGDRKNHAGFQREQHSQRGYLFSDDRKENTPDGGSWTGASLDL